MANNSGEEMQTDQREILIYYNPEVNKHKKTIAHAQGMAPYIKAYAFADASTAQNVWATIYEGLEVDPMTIFDNNHPKYESLIAGNEFDFKDWLKIVAHNPDLIRSPIAMREKKVVICDRQTEIYKLMDGSPSELKQKYVETVPIEDNED